MASMPSILDNKHIPLVLGSDWLGRVFVDDLTTLPHLLAAGSTGSGKSVWLRSQIASIVCLMNDRTVRLVLSDTKNVEFQDFIGCPSLLYGDRALSVKQTVDQMLLLRKETDDRLAKIAATGRRNLAEYNQFVSAESKLPYIVLAIDELADIVEDSDGVDVLDYITRKSRAAGIHCIAATQRPSADIVKGVIKNNFLARVCFRMPDGVNSRIVLGENGAENLMRQGDMLYRSPNFPGLLRLHSGYATSADIQGTLEYAVYRRLGIS
jgi:DNA segregation ATPase FtsK/SpoIIIE, S-DNA-T family